jgi:hypothetical protein
LDYLTLQMSLLPCGFVDFPPLSGFSLSIGFLHRINSLPTGLTAQATLHDYRRPDD